MCVLSIFRSWYSAYGWCRWHLEVCFQNPSGECCSPPWVCVASHPCQTAEPQADLPRNVYRQKVNRWKKIPWSLSLFNTLRDSCGSTSWNSILSYAMTKFLDIMMQFQTSLPTTKATGYYLHLGHLSIIQSDPIHSSNLRFSQAAFICSMAVHSTTSRRAPDARGQGRPRRGRDAGCGWCSGCGHRSIRSLARSGWEETKTVGRQIRSDHVRGWSGDTDSCYTVTNSDSSPLASMLGPKTHDSKARWQNVEKTGRQINNGHGSPKSTWTGLFFGAAPNNLILSAADGGRCMGKWLDKDPAQPTCMFVSLTTYIVICWQLLLASKVLV